VTIGACFVVIFVVDKSSGIRVFLFSAYLLSKMLISFVSGLEGFIKH